MTKQKKKEKKTYKKGSSGRIKHQHCLQLRWGVPKGQT